MGAAPDPRARSLGERLRTVAKALREVTEKLNEALERAEDAMYERSVRPGMVRLPSGDMLSWDGELLWVISKTDKKRLLHCSRQERIEAATMLRALVPTRSR